MTTQKSRPLEIDPHLQVRLSALAKREGASFAEFAEEILRAHADDAEREITESTEDERRWQQYLETGHSVPFDTVRSKVRRLAAEAAAKVEPQ